MNKKRKIITYLSITIIGILGILITVYALIPVRTNYVHAMWAFDVDNTEECVKEAENVFIGKVLKKVGNEKRDSMPETQFKVHVEESIKGSLQGNVIVNQWAGYDVITKSIVLFEGDTLIEEGETYLFTTKAKSELNKGKPWQYWQNVTPIGGKIQVEDEEHKKELVEKYKNIKEEKKEKE